ncbi:MAG: hypothetical protein Q9221_008987 [Calogaya cf. arnoldii]
MTQKRSRGGPPKVLSAATPGPPDDPRKFIRPYSEEAQCAAYSKYVDIGDFRRFLMSGKFLLTFCEFRQISTQLTPYDALALLRDDQGSCVLKSGEEPAKKWPIDNNLKGRELKLMKSYRLANILLHMFAYLTDPFSIEKRPAAELQILGEVEFKKSMQVKVPQTSVNRIVNPQVGPFSSESKLEPYNRIFCLLRYLQYVATSSHWAARFAGTDWDKAQPIKANAIPLWMRPQEAKHQVASLQDLASLSKLKRKKWTVWWKNQTRFQGKEELDNHLEEIGVDLPSTKQTLKADPRHYDAPTWRDCLRRQIECKNLGLNLHSVQLSHDVEFYPEKNSTMNLLNTDWTEVQSTFDSLPEDEVTIEIVLRKLWEDEELWGSGFVLSVEGDVSTSADISLEDEEAASDELDKSKNLNAFLEGETFGSVGPPWKLVKPQDFFASNDEKCLHHHDGHDIWDSVDRLAEWQRKTLLRVAGNPPPARKPSRNTKIGGTYLTAEERDALDNATASGEAAALQREEDATIQDEDTNYYQIQGAFSGTPKQTGPPVDLSLTILGMEKREHSNRYACNLLKNFTTSEFYTFQVNGAVDMCLKSFGRVPLPDEHAATQEVQNALGKLTVGLRTFGGICRDQTGLGKTKLLLLWLALGAQFSNEFSRPTLIVVPASLVTQWAKEISTDWPGFTLFVCYNEDDLPAYLKKNVIKASHLKMLQHPHRLPPHIQKLFSKDNTQSNSIVLTSYETWGDRTVYKQEKEPQHFEWRTRCEKLFQTVIADEAHRCKNRDTRTHASISLLKSWFHMARHGDADAKPRICMRTPFELVGKILKHLKTTLSVEQKEWVKAHQGPNVLADMDALPEQDNRRLVAMDFKRIRNLLRDARKNKVKVAAQFHVMEDLCFLSRSASSVLTNYNPNLEPEQLSNLIKKHHVRTIAPSRTPTEEAEYQVFHLEAARYFYAHS